MQAQALSMDVHAVPLLRKRLERKRTSASALAKHRRSAYKLRWRRLKRTLLKSNCATLDARGAWMARMYTPRVRARHAVPLLKKAMQIQKRRPEAGDTRTTRSRSDYFYLCCAGAPIVSTIAKAIASIAAVASRPCCGSLFTKIEKTRDSPPTVVA